MSVQPPTTPYYLIAVDDRHTPTKGHSDDAGLDLKARIAGRVLTVEPGAVVSIPVGVYAVIAPGYAGYILSRSGLSSRSQMVANAPGLIDPGYTGELEVLYFNAGPKPATVNDGDRIGQFVCHRVEQGRIFGGEDRDEGDIAALIQAAKADVGLTGSTRGTDGFGSTGVATEDDSRLIDRVVDVLLPIADRINETHGANYVGADDLHDAAARLYAEGLLNEGPLNPAEEGVR